MEHQHQNNNQQTGTIYTCTMHPKIKQDKPGTCPICGMTLVLVKKSEREAVASPNQHDANPLLARAIKYKNAPKIVSSGHFI